MFVFADGTVNLFDDEDDDIADHQSDTSDADSDVELLTVLPKSKSRLLPSLPPSFDDGDSGKFLKNAFLPNFIIQLAFR